MTAECPITNLNERRDKRSTKPSVLVWTVVSGKGGIGKSFVASSLAQSVAKTGLKVTLVDLDLNGANLHTFFGLNPRSKNLGHYFANKSSRLSELEATTPNHNVKLIMGAMYSAHLKLGPDHFTRLKEDIFKLNTDVVILDVGAGYGDCQSEFIKISDKTLLVTTPEPTSIESTYRWFESFVFAGLCDHEVARNWFVNKCDGDKYRRSLREELLKTSTGVEVLKRLQALPIHLIVNQVRSYEDEALGMSMKSVMLKYFGAEIKYSGYIQYDNAVWQSIRSRSSVMKEQPFSPLVGQFLELGKQLVDPVRLKAVA